MYIYIDTSHYTYMSIHNVTRITHTYTQTHLYVIITRTSTKASPVIVSVFIVVAFVVTIACCDF